MGWLGFGGIGMILFWVLIIAAVVLVVRAVSNNNGKGGGELAAKPQSPLEILQTRYAKGELSQEEYEEARTIL